MYDRPGKGAVFPVSPIIFAWDATHFQISMARQILMLFPGIKHGGIGEFLRRCTMLPGWNETIDKMAVE
ncbi:MAG: hypothetical protein EBV06_10975, partial [Planctomycetia bacterium]|nr:hypothetical protein [Planctomycetia bacterium]